MLEKLTEAVQEILRSRLGAPGFGSETTWRLRATFPDEAIVQRGTLLECYPIKRVGEDVQIGEPKPVEGPLLALSKDTTHGTILGEVLEEGAAKPGSKWLVAAISEGLSKNDTFYPAEVLQAAVPLYEGAKVFFDHEQKRQARGTRDLAGFLSGARFGTLAVEGMGSQPLGMVLATLNVTAQQLRDQLMEAFEAGKPDLLGLSHCAECEYDLVKLPTKSVRKVKRIQTVESVDVVPFPSAGGRVMRLVAGLKSPTPETPEELQMLDQKIAKLKEARPDLFAKLSAEPTEAEVDRFLMEAITPARQADPPPAQNGAANQSLAELALRAMAGAHPAAAPAAATLSESDRRDLHQNKVDRKLAGRTMRPAMLEMLRENLYARVGAQDAELDAEIERTVKVDSRLATPARNGSGLGVTIEGGADEADKIAEAVDGFFMRGADESVRAEYKKITGHDAPRDGFRSAKRMYEDITGDRDVTGYIQNPQAKRRFQRILEAIQTGSFANLWGDSMHRRMLSEYRATDYSQRWRRMVSRITAVPDFRTQERLRWGSFADLAPVAQLQPYPIISNPTDEKVSFAPSKRGGIVEISREAIKNDDVGMVQELPKRLAFSAARTLHKFVFDLIVTNPTLDDGVALFAAAVTRGHSSAGNIQTAALSTTTVGIARQRLLRVKDRDANTVLGLSPKILIVPPELEEIGLRLTSIPVYPVSGQNATEPNIIARNYGLNELMVLETLTDVTDYFIVADPNLVNTIEIAFVDGQEEPALFVQDQESVGSVFSADKLSWKVRHEYGGDILDWRGFQGGIVAG